MVCIFLVNRQRLLRLNDWPAVQSHRFIAAPQMKVFSCFWPEVPDFCRPLKMCSLNRAPDGRVVNLKNYKLVLFMQSRCGYCQQFDPLLKRVTAQMGLDVFPYTLDGKGDVSFPDAIPATEAVIRDMWSNMRPVTPAAFLVEVNTLKTLPLLYGIVDEQTLRQRIDEALEFANAAVTGTGSGMKASPEFPH
ncbi:type-F conjugative transfer system pilin assembly thiol-disulfide isomerase TrbB [Escherichia albertii]|nr:type-F conjugative transfer system pilin assembly thiol-disulfide isomerase TrbB [Escherichia albertii]EEW7499029.1 type-F conjugative transfer system pilin assembly thiol-disulfide isomerase TrbB [Escherichia albertii]EFF0802948.1 type-F conjugative transfer system pilin assembly thiol-disulfide isomerase TrbB [Escherichia albertii]MLY53593.1 type-F conjugative transfer system pilin assembly thiol-disulfide isomerase TrbB [Escherichia albertii]